MQNCSKYPEYDHIPVSIATVYGSGNQPAAVEVSFSMPYRDWNKLELSAFSSFLAAVLEDLRNEECS